MTSIGEYNRRLFDLGAAGYDLLTGQQMWRDQVARLLDHVDADRRGLRVLDLGCGPGVSTFVLAKRLPEATFVGVDLAPRMIDRAQEHHRRRFSGLKNVRFEQGNATTLPFAAASFDLVVGHSFLYLVPDRPAVLREVCRVLRPGGQLILMEPHADGSLVRAALSSLSGLERFRSKPWQTARFVTSTVLWRVASAAAGRMSDPLARELFQAAGLSEIVTYPTMAGLGLHCMGRKPAVRAKRPAPPKPVRRTRAAKNRRRE